jgi:hypothetical protein
LETIKVGEAGSGGREIHPGHVVHGPEEADLSVIPTVRLHPFKQLLGVVQHLEIENILGLIFQCKKYRYRYRY